MPSEGIVKETCGKGHIKPHKEPVTEANNRKEQGRGGSQEWKPPIGPVNPVHKVAKGERGQ
jgi:hypothetical protein